MQQMFPNSIRFFILFSVIFSTYSFLQTNKLALKSTTKSSRLRSAVQSTDKFNIGTTAIVLIEYQNEFCAPEGKLYGAVEPVIKNSNMLANSVALVQEARKKGCKIIHVPISFSPDFQELSTSSYGILANVKAGSCFVDKSWGADFVDSMKPQPEDIIIKGKLGLCGFESTNLDFVLRQLKVDTIALGGLLTNCCVESTMRAAYEKGYKVVTLVDCTASTSLEAQ
eukprot:gene27386-36021_t